MAKSSYLSQLPKSGQRRGDASKGQIEIVTRKKKGPGPQKDEPEDKEALGETRKMSPQEVADAIRSGEIRDGYTIAALMLAQLAGLMEPLAAPMLRNMTDTHDDRVDESFVHADSSA
jgi:hypothetical protein